MATKNAYALFKTRSELHNYLKNNLPGDEKDADFGEQKMKIVKEWLNSVIQIVNNYDGNKHLHSYLYSFCDPIYKNEKYMEITDENEILKKDNEKLKKDSIPYMLLFLVFILGCIIGKIQGRLF